MILDRLRLLKMLTVLDVAVGNKILDVSFCVQFRIDKQNKNLNIAATDFNAYLVMDYGDLSLSILDDVEDEFLIQFKPLLEIIKNSTTNDVAFKADGDSVLIDTNGIYRFVKYQDPSKFPSFNFEYTPVITAKANDLVDIWNRVSVAVSKDVTQIAYQGVNFDGNWVATDNRRLTIEKGKVEYAGGPMLIPSMFGDIIKKCEGECTIGVNNRATQLILTCPDIGLISAIRLIDAKFVEYQKVLNRDSNACVVTFNKNELSGALTRLSSFTDKVFKVMTVELNRTGDSYQLTLALHNKNGGQEDIESIDASRSGEFPDVFKSKYQIDNFIDGVQVVNGDNVKMTFTVNGMLWIDDGDFSYLLTKIT